MVLAGRRIILDIDAAILIGGSGHLGALVEALGGSLTSTERLDGTLRTLDSSASRQQYPQDFRVRARTALEPLTAFRPTGSSAVIDVLVRATTVGRDAPFIAAAACDQSSMLISGDKEWMKSLAEEDGAPGLIRKQLRGRVCCFEAAIEVLLERLGIEAVAKAFMPIATRDAVRRVFCDGERTALCDALKGVDTMMARRELEVGRGWLWRSPARSAR